MFCPNCGTQNTETAQTCAKCGFQLKTAAAPKFKGTMLMMNQPGSIPGAPPRPGSSPQAAPPAQADAGGAPASGGGFTAEAPPIGTGAPMAGAAARPGASPSRLKGTMVGVAPPAFGGPAQGPGPQLADMGGPPPGGTDQQTFGSAADANPLAGTMALDGPPNFANVPGAPPAAAMGGGGGGAPAFGAPPPDAGAFNPPPYGAPDAGAYGAPPPGGGGGPYGAPPQGAPPGGGGPYGAPPQGGDPYGAGAPGAPPPGGGYGGAPMQGGPAMGQPQDFGGQMNQGFQQAGQAFGQAADQFGNAVNQGMQPYAGGNPMMQQPGMGGPGMNALVGGVPGAGGPPKQFMITLLLALFAGSFGAHRFYTGHILYGVIQLCTLGGCGVWALIDIIMIITGKYTDAQGRPLQK